jgi:hypothetical protein
MRPAGAQDEKYGRQNAGQYVYQFEPDKAEAFRSYAKQSLVGKSKPLTKQELADKAGMCERQQLQFQQVNNVPRKRFEKRVEGAKPPPRGRTD